jgi:CheY-like chemotaxis protein
MSDPSHLALVVEDEPEAAADLVEILRTCGCEAVVATNRRDALVQLASAVFCIVLLDLEIGSEPDSIRGRVANGKEVLNETRRRFPEREGTTHALPIIVISGFAAETEAAVAAMRDGASDVVQKLSSAKDKADRIYAALEHAGRTSHRRCQELLSATKPMATSGMLTLSIPAEREGRRVLVMLGGRRAAITLSSLKILLHLVKARLGTGVVHKIDLGGSADRGFKAISVLRNDLKQAYSGDPKLLITNDQQGGYAFADIVSIEDVNAEKLALLDNRQITNLAREIRNLLNEKQESDGKS